MNYRTAMRMKTVLATAALLAALIPGAGVAHADTTRCDVNASGAMWCVDDTGQSWEQSPEGSYPDNPYCSPYVHRVQCGD